MSAMCLGITAAMLVPTLVVAQTAPLNRTVLPIPEPNYPHSTVLDVRDAKAPPRFEIKAPAGAPNVLIVLVDDIGFGMPSACGGPGRMPTAEQLANKRLRYAYAGKPGSVAGPATGPRGNLRDSDATASRYGYKLYDWCVHFDESMP